MSISASVLVTRKTLGREEQHCIREDTFSSNSNKITSQKEMVDSVKSFNQQMVRVAPELASKYAAYPMKHKQWINPASSTVDGEPCFVAGNSGENLQNHGVLMDYVYGRGPMGLGYYHLMTREAYVNLYGRLQSTAPSPPCCFCLGGSAKDYGEHRGVKDVVYNRSISPIPDDKVARKAAQDKARGVAQDWHNGLQNEQLVVGTAITAIHLSS